MHVALLIQLVVGPQPMLVVQVSNDEEASRVIKVPVPGIARLRDLGLLGDTPPRLIVPELFSIYPVPQSMKVNVDGRADLKKQGVPEKDIGIGESVGAFQAEADGYWFGKSFYNAEGEVGQGAIGFLSRNGRYSLLEIPALRKWSVSALLVERDRILAGLVHRGESGESAGGLLIYNRKTRRAEVRDVPHVIHGIAESPTGILLGTREGLLVMRDGGLTRVVWSRK